MSSDELKDQIIAAQAAIDEAKKERGELLEEATDEQKEILDQEDISQEAKPSNGYMSKEEWIAAGKNPDAWKTPDKFESDGSFFRKIEAQNKKIDELMGVVKNLDEHNKKVSVASYNKGVEDALARREEAVEIGDVDAFKRADNDLRTLEKHKPVEEQTSNNNVVTQDMLDFVEENKSWFNNSTPLNARMVKEADGLFVLESQDNPHKSQKEVLEVVKSKLALLHPDVFENPNKEKPITITKSSSVKVSKGESALVGRLTEDQKQFFKQAASAGCKMKIEEYAKQLDMTGDLRND